MKKSIACLLVFTLLIAYLPNRLFANSQTPAPSKTISSISVRSTKNKNSLDPNVIVQWNGVQNKEVGNGEGEQAKHFTEFYQYKLTDMTSGQSIGPGEVEVEKTGDDEATKSYSVDLNELKSKNFTSGKLFKIEVIPGHWHERRKADGTFDDPVRVTPSNNQAIGYFITDLDTKIENIDNQLCITFEYIKGASYKGQYIAASRKTVEQVENGVVEGGANIKPIPFEVTESYASKTENQINGRVKFPIKDAIPGQIYSAYTTVSDVAESVVGNYAFSQIVQNELKTESGPKVAVGVKEITLTYNEIEPDLLELRWEIGSWAGQQGVLNKTSVYTTNKDGEIEKLVKIINHKNLPDGADMASCLTTRPTETTYFKVVVDIEGVEEDAPSNVLQYIPNKLVDKPLKPQVPLAGSKEILKELIGKDEIKDYTVSNYIHQNRSEEDIVQDMFTVLGNGTTIQLVWDAPQKKDENGNPIIDEDLKYDIYVSDKNDFSNISPTYKNQEIGKSKEEQIVNADSEKVIGFKKKLTKYTTQYNTEAEIEPNKTYYIKIVAKRLWGSENDDEFFYSEPTITSITTKITEEIFTPPSLAKPPLKLQGTTTNSATLRWRTNWYEILIADQAERGKYQAIGQKLQAEQWNSEVFKGKEDPFIRFKGESEEDENKVLETSDDVSQVLGWTTTTSGAYRTRQVILGADTKYETKVIPYQKAMEFVSTGNSANDQNHKIQDWILTDMEEDTKDIPWNQNVNPNIPTENKETRNEEWLEWTEEGLEPNTRYLILVRAYRVVNGDKKLISYPSYVIATTAPNQEDLNPIPTVPVLQLKKDATTDESITVFWKYNNRFDYELVYSRLEDPEKATPWEFTITDVPGDENYNIDENGNVVIKITGLQPESTYNIWLRAKQKQGNEQSKWSNPVTETTKTIAAPDPPRGLGKADYQSILASGKDFKPVGENYITVEWIKDPSDVESETSAKVYSYVLEMADNVEFADAITVNTSGENTGNNNTGNAQGNNGQNTDDQEKITYEVLGKTLVRFNNLRPNYPYYFRVKTIVTYTNEETKQEIVKESEFCDMVRVITSTSNSEYEGGENPNVVEYETPVVETFKNDIWTYEMVDAAKITTQILSNKEYNYTVTLKNYKGKYDALTRRLKMPVKIMDTLSNQGMNLQVVTNIGTYQIPGEALKSYLQEYAGADTLQIDLTRKSSTDIAAYIRPQPDNYVAGEDLQILFRSEGKSTKVNTLNKPMTVKLNSEAPGNYNYENLFTYSYNYAKGDWDTYQYQVDTENNKLLSFTTSYPGLNALYSRSIADSGASSSYIMNALSSNYNIMGLGNPYTENSKVMGSQYVTLMLGVARETQNINLTQGASEADYKAARAAGLYNGNRGNVTREEALAGVVKLYEIKHGNKLKASNMTFPGVSANYAQAVSKAYAAGLIESMTSPKANVTYAELCDWIALAIE